MTAPLLFQHVVCPVAGSRHAVMSVVVVVVLLLVVEVLVVVVEVLVVVVVEVLVVVVVEVLVVVVVEVLAVVVVEVLAVVVVVGVVVVVVLLPPGGATLSAKVPLAPPYPSTMMKYVCPAVTVDGYGGASGTFEIGRAHV